MECDGKQVSHASERDKQMELLVKRVLTDCVRPRRRRRKHVRMTLPTPVLESPIVTTQPAIPIVPMEPVRERQTEGLLVAIGVLVGFSLAQLLWNIF